MIRLYTYFRSSSAFRVRIALNLKSIEYELIPVHLVKDGGQQRTKEYLEKNPMGQIPMLEHNDFRLTQSLPIIQYLDEINSEPNLFSEDVKKKCQQLELCEIINSGIQPIQNLKVLQYLKSDFKAEKNQIQEWSRHWIHTGFAALEKRLEKTSGKYSFGDSVSAVDCFVVPQVFNAHRYDVEVELFPNISKVNENCLKLKAFRDAQPDQQPDAE